MTTGQQRVRRRVGLLSSPLPVSLENRRSLAGQSTASRSRDVAGDIGPDDTREERACSFKF
jgi:hypothetical protein